MKHWFKFVIYLFVAFVFSAANAGSYEDFFRAIESDDAQTLSTLLARGFDPNSPDERGQSGLLLALRAGSNKAIEVLVARPDTQIDKANSVGETPLMMSALRGRLDWTQRLLERGAQVNREGWTPLHYACSGPEAKIVALLLDRGAQIDARSPNGTTPLMMAARYGSEDAAALLISRGADPKLRNDKGLDAADFARQGGKEALGSRLAQLAR